MSVLGVVPNVAIGQKLVYYGKVISSALEVSTVACFEGMATGIRTDESVPLFVDKRGGPLLVDLQKPRSSCCRITVQ